MQNKQTKKPQHKTTRPQQNNLAYKNDLTWRTFSVKLHETANTLQPLKGKSLFPLPWLPLPLHLELPCVVVIPELGRPFRMSSLFSSMQRRSPAPQCKPACLSFTGMPSSRTESLQGESDRCHWGVWKRNTGVDSIPLLQWQKVIRDISHSLTRIWGHYGLHRQMLIQL